MRFKKSHLRMAFLNNFKKNRKNFKKEMLNVMPLTKILGIRIVNNNLGGNHGKEKMYLLYP